MQDGQIGEFQPADTLIRDRPEGQAEPEDQDRPNLTRKSRMIAWAAVVIAIAAWFLALNLVPRLSEDRFTIAVILLAFSAAAAVVPLQVALQQEMSLDLAVIVAAALLLDPRWSVPAVVLGYVIGYAIRYRATFDIDCPFNSGVFAITLSLASLWLHLLDWEFQPQNEPFWQLVGMGATVALIHLVILRVSLAIAVQSQTRQPWRQVLRDNTLGMQTAEQAMLGAMIALGILGAAVAPLNAGGLLLIAVPAFALWLALRQNVETRHRIEASLETAQSVAGIGSLDWDLIYNDLRWSPILFRILGYEPGSVAASVEAYMARVHPDDLVAVLAEYERATTGDMVEVNHRVLLPDGRERAFNVKFHSVRDRHQNIKRVVGTIHDVTDRKLLEERLQYQAFHDPLTALPNRAMFLNRLEQSFARYGLTGEIALLYLDLDRFKLINDTLGHDAGDQLLQTVARRLESCIRPNDMVARLGGDEFIVLLDAVRSDDEAVTVAERIIQDIHGPLSLAGRDVIISTSVGIVRPGENHATSDDLLRDADTALYQAKERGRNRFAFFESTMSDETRDRLELEQDLRSAVGRNELSLVFQPRIELRSGRIAMVEAFIRWTHPSRGAISPAHFIPIAEEIGLASDVGDWVIRAALRDLAEWTKHLVNPPVLSINISGRHLLGAGFAATIEHQLAAANLRPAQVRLEVSEQALVTHQDAAVLTIEQLASIGIRVSIDDFGTGHLSLNALRRYPVDMLQLDRQFVSELGIDPDSQTVARAVIGLAHGLGLIVIAEGVETEAEVLHLEQLGCELAQGHFFAPPLPSNDLLQLLASQPSTVP